MRRAAPAWMLVLLTCACAGPARSAAASAEGNARAEIARMEARWLAALAPGGDRHDLQTILADDFIDIDWQGRVRHKADLLDTPARSRQVTQHVTDLRVRVWRDTGVATGINHVHSANKGWSVDVSFTDVFVRTDGRWRAVSAQETLRKPAVTPGRQS